MAERKAVVIVLLAVLVSSVAQAQTISIDGDHFVVDRGDGAGPQPRFLTFISYFDGMRARDLAGDLDYIANTLHFDGIRVLPNWQARDARYCTVASSSTSLFDARGNIRGDTRTPTLQLKKLIDLIEAAAARKLIVDVSFTRETVPGLSMANYVRAITRTATLLRPYRNVIFDFGNERNINTVPEAEVRQLRDAVLANPDPAQGDPARIVVASNSGDASPGDTVGFVQRTELSAVAYHDPRVTDWAAQTGKVVAELRASGKPVYLQEPEAWNSGLLICNRQEPTTRDADGDPAHFRTAVQAARTAGAAAWTFHTRQGFRLNGTATMRSLIRANATQKALLEGTPTEKSLGATAQTGSWGLSTGGRR